ncbi:hypothetical protein Srubr_45990 [Streptomyces rubradiris]|uniref:Uncharacterized protein n=1 Tax=Streptomyces rubradiris TaxID=285531 RepID=A0ABQ3RFW7_STRRR|nr:hypothetical protein GCM10018792_53120 [Streptomyces rubradiris]GHI54753.1 hypothetical protein Srubr_45990 [Streptomyces rubradiris]
MLSSAEARRPGCLRSSRRHHVAPTPLSRNLHPQITPASDPVALPSADLLPVALSERPSRWPNVLVVTELTQSRQLTEVGRAFADTAVGAQGEPLAVDLLVLR